MCVSEEEGRESKSPETVMILLAGCPRCLMYVMLPEKLRPQVQEHGPRRLPMQQRWCRNWQVEEELVPAERIPSKAPFCMKNESGLINVFAAKSEVKEWKIKIHPS